MNVFQKYFVESITKRYAQFSGRARRAEYWWYTLFNGIIGAIFSVWFQTDPNNKVALVLSGVYMLALLLPGLAITVRRLHDIGKSGWLYLLILIPIIGWIIIFVWSVTPGDVGDNEYGEDPKAEERR